ncbi:MAG TPA: hypothetical protein VGU63_05730 [Candidatus Acidoferrales bacterium]|nr:hypothetical protein [Candidatus Acidoferrales bacterium]
MDWGGLWQAFRNNWGGIVSVAGLGVSVATLVVATKAKDAADAAKAEARRQNLIDEIQDAQNRTEQLGAYLSQQKWEIVQIKSQEVISSCSQILRRWGRDSLTERSRNNFLVAQQQAGSIAEVAVRALRNAPSDREFKILSIAQHKALELLSVEAAEFAGMIEKTR